MLLPLNTAVLDVRGSVDDVVALTGVEMTLFFVPAPPSSHTASSGLRLNFQISLPVLGSKE